MAHRGCSWGLRCTRSRRCSPALPAAYLKKCKHYAFRKLVDIPVSVWILFVVAISCDIYVRALIPDYAGEGARLHTSLLASDASACNAPSCLLAPSFTLRLQRT